MTCVIQVSIRSWKSLCTLCGEVVKLESPALVQSHWMPCRKLTVPSSCSPVFITTTMPLPSLPMYKNVSFWSPLPALCVRSKTLWCVCGDVQVESSYVQPSTEGKILVALGQERVPRLPRARDSPVHCRDSLSCPAPPPSCLLVPWPALWVS